LAYKLSKARNINYSTPLIKERLFSLVGHNGDWVEWGKKIYTSCFPIFFKFSRIKMFSIIKQKGRGFIKDEKWL
jgi:hypothetical protein